jgi:hypothetical protein
MKLGNQKLSILILLSLFILVIGRPTLVSGKQDLDLRGYLEATPRIFEGKSVFGFLRRDRMTGSTDHLSKCTGQEVSDKIKDQCMLTKPQTNSELSSSSTSQLDETTSILIGEVGALRAVEIDKYSGNKIRETAGFKSNCVDRLDNNNLLICDGSRIVELSQSDGIVWEASGFNLVEDAERLSNGNTLICVIDDASSSPYGRVIEVDANGDTLWSYSDLHWPSQATRLSNGNTLIADGTSLIKEVAPNGSITWSAYTTRWASSIVRLANGNTLVGESTMIEELDKDGNIVWSKDGFGRIGSVQRLDNGNIIAADGDNDRVIEIAPSGNLVWAITDLNRPWSAQQFASVEASGYSVSHIEITQATQTVSNSVPLIEGKSTFVRVYMDCTSTDDLPDFSTASLQGYGSSGSLGASLRPHHGYSNEACQYSFEEQRKDPKKTLNFTLPAGWRSGEIKLAVQAVGATKSATVSFQPAERLDVIYVPIQHRSDRPNLDRIQQGFLWASRIYPTAQINYVRGSTLEWNGCLQKELPWCTTDRDVNNSISDLLNELTTQYRLSNAYVFGWLPEETLDGGISRPRWVGGEVAIGDDHTTEGQRIFAHEIAHVLGRRHTNTDSCHPEVIDPKSQWPYDDSLIQDYGLEGNSFGWLVSSSSVVKDPTTTYDYMSYCGRLDEGTSWTSGWTYKRLYSEFFGNNTASLEHHPLTPPQPYVIASGLVYTDVTATFDPMWVVTSTEAPYNPPVGTQYCLEAQANDSTVLADHCFDLPFENYETGEATDVDGFNVMLPYTAEIDRIVLKKGTSELVAQLASGHSPTVTILSPTSGDVWTSNDIYTVTWIGSDSDDDSLTYSVFYSSNGTDWMPLGTTITATQKLVNSAEIPGGSGTQIRVMVSDGLNTARSESEPFTVGSKGPEAFILSPSSSLTVTRDTSLWLHGYAYDPEDRILQGTSLGWTSSLDGELGTGTELLPTLSLGQHTLTFTATDSDENVVTANVEVTVVTTLGYKQQVYLPLTLSD